MKLRFTPRAAQDIAAIADFVHVQNPDAAERVRGAILDSLQTLVLFPNAGRRQNIEGVRKLVTRKYPYLVYYTIDAAAEETIILAVQHPARGRLYADE